MKQKYTCLILCFFLIFLTGCNKKNSIDFSVLENKEELSEEVRNSLNQQGESEEPIIYKTSLDGVTEYLAYYGWGRGKNLYQTIKLKPYFEKDSLRLEFSIEPAINDSDVTDELFAYFSVDKEVRNIEVYVDKQQMDHENVIEVEKIKS